MANDSEAEPRLHATRIMLELRIDEFLELRKGHDLIENRVDLLPAHTKEGAAEVDILATGQIRMEAGSHFEETADATPNLEPAGRRLGNS